MRRRRVGGSLTEDVHAALREEILAGDRVPGERLLVATLGEQFSVSPSVVREVLTRLAEQGLARSVPQIGFTVAPLSIDDLVDLTWARIQIEGLMIRRAVVEGDLAWESAVVAAHHALAGTPTYDEVSGARNPLWRQVHSEFHAAVASGCPSQVMARVRAELYDKSELYRAWSRRDYHDRDVALEHRQICEAALDRDADRAVLFMRDHIQLTTDRLLSFLAEHGDELGVPLVPRRAPVAD
jgi:DNA-binding GntR family transcriptional regulator